MIDQIKEILSRLKTKYPITDTWSGDNGEFKVIGIDDTFYITFLSCDHFILSNNYSWHEHFTEREGGLYGLDGPYSLEEFLNGLFMGTIQIIVKYRGNTPVAQKVGVLRDGKMEVNHRTIPLLPLPRFWQKACYKKLDYELANSQKDVIPMSESSERILCSDGNCVGTIDERGYCSICRKPLGSFRL